MLLLYFKNMTEEEYRKEWESGLHKTEYNAARFCEDPEKYITDWYFRNVGFINFNEPKTLIDVIACQKLRMFKDLEYRKLCSKWSDKIKVNDELKNLGMKEIIIPNIIEKYRNITKEDLKILNSHNTYLIKTNHGSGWNIKTPMNEDFIINKVNEWLSLNYCYVAGYECQYKDITPGFLIQESLTGKNIPIDYSFWCRNGEIIGIGLTKKLSKCIEEYLYFVDENGNKSKWYVGNKPECANLTSMFKKNIELMKPYVKEISKAFDFVRVDLYYVNNKIYFGEATFTPCGGRLDVIKDE